MSAWAYAGVLEEPRARVHRIEKAVFAPCCYTETVGQHQSEIAVQMRVEIAKWVEQGRTDEEILDTYAKPYGAKVLVDPNTIPKGWTLVVPWVIAGLGMLGAAWILGPASSAACHADSIRCRRDGPPGRSQPGGRLI